jgi:hypothetical protein
MQTHSRIGRASQLVKPDEISEEAYYTRPECRVHEEALRPCLLFLLLRLLLLLLGYLSGPVSEAKLEVRPHNIMLVLQDMAALKREQQAEPPSHSKEVGP